MEKLQKSMTVYVKSLSKRNEVEDKEKILPVGYLGQTMIHHGEDFEPDSEFGNCLISTYTAWNRGSLIDRTQVWAEQMRKSLGSKKVTSTVPPTAGSSH